MRVLLLLFAILLSLLSSPCPAGTAAQRVEYKNPTLNMELQLQEGWKQSIEDQKEILYKQITPNRRAIIFLSTNLLGRNIDNLDIERILDARINFERTINEINDRSFTTHSSGIKTINSHKAIQFYFSSQNVTNNNLPEEIAKYQVPEPTSEIKTTIYVGRTGYEINLLCHPDDVTSIAKDYNATINSFRPLI